MNRVLPEAVIDAVAELLTRRTGLTFPASRRRALADSISQGLMRAGSLETYLGCLDAEGPAFDHLVAEVTIGETYFFRDPEQLATIRERILSRLRLAPSNRPVRIWSAGCASGEEPYTLAMLALESGLGDRVHILATDVSRAALARARRARYTRWSLRSTPEDSRSRYFREVDGEFEVVEQVRELVEFRYLNLATDSYPSLCHGIWGMDLILCRNVLIYLDQATIRRVAARLLASLDQDGWLVLGASDPPLADSVPCEAVITESGLLYRRPRRASGHGPRPDYERPMSVTLTTERLIASAPVPEPPLVQVPPAEEAPPAMPLPPRRPEPQPCRKPDIDEALQAYLRGDYQLAEALAARATTEADSPPESWVLRVRAAANRGDLEAAGTACIAGLERYPDCAELVYLHGLLLIQRGLLSQAVTAFRRALYLDRGLAVVHLTLGQALARLGERDGARRSLRNAMRLLLKLPREAQVPAGDGELAGRLLEMVRVQLSWLGDR